MNRIHSLDYLRGLAAAGIMVYHHFTWTIGQFSAETVIERVGVYGVSIFYVLSGLTLYHVYYPKMNPSGKDVLSFFKKRTFRIFPLLWLVTIITVFIIGKAYEPADLLLNLTGLFGFVKWDTYFSPGVWSIGNELVFYIFFPFFMLFSKSVRALMWLLSLLILSSHLYFAFVVLDVNVNLAEQWRNYVNPLNQVFLFLGGFLMGRWFDRTNIKNSVAIAFLIVGVLLFIFYPVTGDSINLVTGFNRLVFTSICFLVCFSFYKISFNLPTLLHKPLALLGEASYSVYLLHPIVFFVVMRTTNQWPGIPGPVKILTSIMLTLVFSNFTYQYFEKYFMKLGRSNKKKEQNIS